MTLLRRSSEAPLHMQLAQIIKAKITSGAWENGAPIPTEKELCSEFDVARGTVRQALQTLESEGFLRRQQGRGTFVTFGDTPIQGAGAARARLALIVPYVRDSSVLTILMGFQTAAERSNYSVAFYHVGNNVREQARVIERCARAGIAGIALYPVDSEVAEPLEQFMMRLPVVLIDRYMKNLSTDFVMSDHFGGALRGMHYLLDQGHRRIGFATWLSPAVSMEHRYLGYQQALRERGIAPESALVCYVAGYPTIDLTPLRMYLSSPKRPSAIFAANDQIAIALYRAAAQIGLRVPEDLAIMGFDDLDIAERLSPPLTTIAQQFLEIGQTSADILLRRIQGDASAFYQVTIAPKLMIRASCLPAAQMQSALDQAIP